jgi:hypothetical protein
MKTAGMVGALFALKIGFIRFLSFVFQIRKLVKEYVTVLYLIYFNTLFNASCTINFESCAFDIGRSCTAFGYCWSGLTLFLSIS